MVTQLQLMNKNPAQAGLLSLLVRWFSWEVWRRGEWNRHSLRKGRNFATGCSTLRASEGSSEILLCEFRGFLQLCRSHAQAVMTGSRNLALLCCAWLSACQHMILDAGITAGSHPECFANGLGFAYVTWGFAGKEVCHCAAMSVRVGCRDLVSWTTPHCSCRRRPGIMVLHSNYFVTPAERRTNGTKKPLASAQKAHALYSDLDVAYLKRQAAGP